LNKLEDGRDSDQQKRLLGRLDKRVEDLLRKAMRHAGYEPALVDAAEIEWRKVGLLPGVNVTDRFVPHIPEKLRKHSCYHVRIRWRDADGRPIPIPGPVVIGGGRFCGFGLFLPTAD
jgi:CRISPR-associated protein Csb2